MSHSGVPVQNVQRYEGKFRATVVNNIDPMQLGRIRAEVAGLPNAIVSWAMPCVPYVVPGSGHVPIPPVGAGVWIEFEQGNPDFPIWSGCFWRPGEPSPFAS